MASTYIDQFNEVTGQVFGKLYEAFPIPTLLNPASLGYPEHEFGQYDPVTEVSVGATPITLDEIIFGHTVEWLMEAGYLTYGPLPRGSFQANRTYFQNARLTAKGLEVLNAIPSNLTKREPLGQQLAAASKSGGKELLRTITTEALGIGVQIGAKALGL